MTRCHEMQARVSKTWLRDQDMSETQDCFQWWQLLLLPRFISNFAVERPCLQDLLRPQDDSGVAA